MPSIDKQPIKIPCPTCKHEMSITYYDICSRREAKCPKCNAKYKFEASTASALHTAVGNLEYAQEKVKQAIGKALEKATVAP